MSESDIIQISIAVVTFLGIIISSIIAIVSIKQNNKNKNYKGEKLCLLQLMELC